MPMIQHRKVEITIEYVTADTCSTGQLADRITASLEAASDGLAKDLESGIDSYRVTHTAIWPRRFGSAGRS